MLKTKEVDGGGLDAGIGGSEEFFDTFGANLALIVQNPEDFEGGLFRLVFCQPGVDGWGDVRGVTENAAGMVADEVLGMVQEFEEFVGGGTFDLGPVFDGGFFRVGNSPNSAVFAVPSWVPHAVLGVADDAGAEVGDVHGSIESEGDVNGAEGLVGGGEDVEAVGALEVSVRSFHFGNGDEAFAKEDGGCHALLVFVGEIGAGDGGGGGTFAVANGDAAAEGVVDAEGCPGHGIAVLDEAVTVHLKEIAPAVPGDFPWIGGEGLVFELDGAGAKVEAVGGGVDAAGDAVGSFDLGTVKDAVAEEDVTERSHGDHAAVVSIGDVDAAEEFFLVISFAIAVGVLHVDEARLVRDDDSVFVKGDAVGDGEVVSEDGGFVGFAIAIGVFENDDLVGRNVAGNGARE